MKSINFLPKREFDSDELNRLHKGLKARFRFNYKRIDTMPLSKLIDIKYFQGDKDVANRLSDYVNGFLDAIE